MRGVILSLIIGIVSSLEMRCSSLFGLETALKNTDCSWEHPSSYYIDELGSRGFNWLRIPFSGEYVRNGDYHILDSIFQSAQKWNMKILLDWHRNINEFQDNWLEHISLQDYLDTYKSLIRRYKDNPTLQMIGIFNEYKNDDVVYWKGQMDYVVNELEKIFPNRFMWLIGGYTWSSNHHDLDWSHLPFADRVYQDIHQYHFSGTGDQKNWEYNFPSNRQQTVVGEWGYMSDKPNQIEWAHRFVDWLKNNNMRNTCFWVSVTNSGDTGGLWKECREFEYSKYDLLRSLWYDKRQLTNTTTPPQPLVIVFQDRLRKNKN